jgi:hypothetical protein
MTVERRALIASIAAAGVLLAAVLVFALPSWHRQAAPQQRPGIQVSVDSAAENFRVPGPAPPSSAHRALYLALSEPIGAIAASDRIVDQNAESVELTRLVQPLELASAPGRVGLRELLSRAEEVAELRLEITEQNFARLRDAAQKAPVDASATRSFVGSFDAQAERTRVASEQLFETQRQAIATGRRLLAFMEDNRALYDVAEGGVRFRSAALQDQFSHYLSQTGQILKREQSMRNQVIVARQEQQQLLRALDAGG